MKHHQIEKRVAKYPVAPNIMENSKVFSELANEWSLTAQREIQASDKVVLVCRGSSGAIVSTIFYLELAKSFPEKEIIICHIKKEEEYSHSSKASGLPHVHFPSILYVWVDDFIDSGRTFEKCAKAVREYYKEHSNLDFKFDWAVCISTHTNPTCFADLTENLFCNWIAQEEEKFW